MIRKEILLPASRDEVWSALTDPEELERWFANDVELDLRPGGGAHFRWGNGEFRHATIIADVRACSRTGRVGPERAARLTRPSVGDFIHRMRKVRFLRDIGGESDQIPARPAASAGESCRNGGNGGARPVAGRRWTWVRQRRQSSLQMGSSGWERLAVIS